MLGASPVRPACSRSAPPVPRGHRPAAAGVECLESRMLLAFSAVGPEFRVNSPLPDQDSNPSLASDADGDFVVAYVEFGDQLDSGVAARRFSASGDARGDGFRVNTSANGDPRTPAVACDADGDFVVTWATYDPAADLDGVYARRFNSAGVAQGDEFRVSIAPVNTVFPAVAMDDAGNFVVAWNDPSSTTGAFARLYSATGAARGNPFPVGGPDAIRCDIDADGDFVVAWRSFGLDGDIYAQRYDADGAPRGGPLRVNTLTAGNQSHPSVSCDADGDFVVAWTSLYEPDGYFYGVRARRYDASGVARGDEFPVSTFRSPKVETAVACDADGDFVVTWNSILQDGFRGGVYARRFDAGGAPDGGEFRVNTTTAGNQGGPDVASDADGDFVIAWTQEVVEDNEFIVYAYGQRYAVARPLQVTGVFIGGAAWAEPFRTFLATAGIGSAAHGYQVPGGAAQAEEFTWSNLDRVSIRFSTPALVQQADLRVRGVNVSNYPTIAFTYDPGTNTATWTLGQTLANDRVALSLDADGPGGVTDAGGARLDGDWINPVGAAAGGDTYPSGDGTPGGDFVFRINILPGDVNRSGSVLADDFSAVKRKFFASTINPGTGEAAYSVFHDINGSGSILADDFSGVKQRFFDRLPDGQPSIEVLQVFGDIPVSSRAARPPRRDLLDPSVSGLLS